MGAWAAGSASRLSALADSVPEYIECVTAVADDDGQRHAARLVLRLKARGIEAWSVTPVREVAA
jgi:hypothetical protein